MWIGYVAGNMCDRKLEVPKCLLLINSNMGPGKSVSDWWGTDYVNKIYDLVPVSNPNTNYCFVMNSVAGFIIITEDFSAFFSRSRFGKVLLICGPCGCRSGCCCFLPHQESFWYLASLAAASISTNIHLALQLRLRGKGRKD